MWRMKYTCDYHYVEKAKRLVLSALHEKEMTEKDFLMVSTSSKHIRKLKIIAICSSQYLQFMHLCLQQ